MHYSESKVYAEFAKMLRTLPSEVFYNLELYPNALNDISSYEYENGVIEFITATKDGEYLILESWFIQDGFFVYTDLTDYGQGPEDSKKYFLNQNDDSRIPVIHSDGVKYILEEYDNDIEQAVTHEADLFDSVIDFSDHNY